MRARRCSHHCAPTMPAHVRPYRPTRSATTSTSSATSKGFARWAWYPASSERFRSSERANAVSASAGMRSPRRLACAQCPHELVAVHLRHADVADDDGRAWRVFNAAKRLLGRGERGHRRRLILEHASQQLARVRFVVDDEDVHAGEPGQREQFSLPESARWDACARPASSFAAARCDSGRSTKKVAPCPSPWLVARIVPPCSFDQLLRDRQTQAETAESPRGRAVVLREAVEDVRQKARPECRCRCR